MDFSGHCFNSRMAFPIAANQLFSMFLLVLLHSITEGAAEKQPQSARRAQSFSLR
jgi:hypothetical protein